MSDDSVMKVDVVQVFVIVLSVMSPNTYRQAGRQTDRQNKNKQ